MDYDFDTKEKYIAFLEELFNYCDKVTIFREDDIGSYEPIEEIMGKKAKVAFVRKVPGYARLRGELRQEALTFPLSRSVKEGFKKYDKFLKVCYNEDISLGLDMAFYKGDSLIFYVIRHEGMNYLEDDYEPYFEEVILRNNIDLNWHE